MKTRITSCALLHSSAKRLITFLRFLLQPLELPRGNLTRRVGCLKVGVYHRLCRGYGRHAVVGVGQGSVTTATHLQALPRQIESAELLVSFGLAVHDRVVGRVELKNPVTCMALTVWVVGFWGYEAWVVGRTGCGAMKQSGCRSIAYSAVPLPVFECRYREAAVRQASRLRVQVQEANG